MMASPILHVSTHNLCPSLMQTNKYVPVEFLYCGAPEIALYTPLGENGWATKESLEEALEKLDYKGYTVCETCMAHADVALWLLGNVG